MGGHPPPPPQRREQWVPKAGENEQPVARGEAGLFREGAEMVRGVSPWGLTGNWDSAPATCSQST